MGWMLENQSGREKNCCGYHPLDMVFADIVIHNLTQVTTNNANNDKIEEYHVRQQPLPPSPS